MYLRLPGATLQTNRDWKPLAMRLQQLPGCWRNALAVLHQCPPAPNKDITSKEQFSKAWSSQYNLLSLLLTFPFTVFLASYHQPCILGEAGLGPAQLTVSNSAYSYNYSRTPPSPPLANPFPFAHTKRSRYWPSFALYYFSHKNSPPSCFSHLVIYKQNLSSCKHLPHFKRHLHHRTS